MPEHEVWISQDLPTDPHEAFKIVNKWAVALQEWGVRVAAMCAIVEATLDMPPQPFERVEERIREKDHHRHSKQAIQTLLQLPIQPHGGQSVVTFPQNMKVVSDLVGHPPDPPFNLV
jgi:hypothetical protein